MADRERRNERIVRGLFEDVVNGNRYEQIPEYCTEDVVVHRPGDEITVGIDAYENHYRTLHAAFPDFDATPADVVVEGDCVATRLSVTGTHEGELLGIPATGREVTFGAQILFHLDDGAVTEEYHQSDHAALRDQLG